MYHDSPTETTPLAFIDESRREDSRKAVCDDVGLRISRRTEPMFRKCHLRRPRCGVRLIRWRDKSVWYAIYGTYIRDPLLLLHELAQH